MPENTKRPSDYETLDDYFKDLTIAEMFGLNEIDQTAELVLKRNREAVRRDARDDDPQEIIALAHVTFQRVREMVSVIDSDDYYQYETADLKESIRQTINRTLNIITFGREGYARILAEEQAQDGS